MYFKMFNLEDSKKEYDFLINILKLETNNNNEYKYMNYETFKTKAVSWLNTSSSPLDKDLYYFLHDDDKIVGLFKISINLKNKYKENNGNIGYIIDEKYRNKGYATKGLKLLINLIKEKKLIKEQEIYFTCLQNNKHSIKVILNNGGYIHHYKNDKVYLRIRLDNLKLKNIPLEDFDKDKKQFLAPEKEELIFNKGSCLIVCYFGEEIDKLLINKEIKVYYDIKDTTHFSLYQDIKNNNLFYVKGLVGSPLMGSYLDLFIKHGLKNILFIGGAGCLIDNKQGEIFVVKEALRDEGFSFHYAKPSRVVLANEKVIKIMTNFLNKNNISYQLAKTWTIDAIYRETKNKVKLRKLEGCQLVEMEQAGLIALTNFYKVNYGALIYAGDDLSKAKHSWRDWQNLNVRNYLLKIARELVLLIGGKKND